MSKSHNVRLALLPLTALALAALPSLPRPAHAALRAGQSYKVDTDGHTGDEETTQPKSDANDGRNGDNPRFKRHNVARAHLDYWYTSSHQDTAGEPDPRGEQWVDYVPPMGEIGTGRYRIETRYRFTSARASYPCRYTVQTASGPQVVERAQNTGTDYVDITLGEFDLGDDAFVRAQDTGAGSLTFFGMKFTYLGPATGGGGGGGGTVDPGDPVDPMPGTLPDVTAPTGDGVLKVAPGGHYLQYRGRRVVLSGDSVTQGWQELGTDFDQRAWIDSIASRGGSVAMIWSYIGITDQRGDVRIGYDAPELWPWARGAGGSFDLRTLNDAYFTRLRELVDYAARRDVIVLITVHDGWTKTRFDGHPFAARNGGPLGDRAQYVELASPGREVLGEAFDGAWGRTKKHQWYLEKFCAGLTDAVGNRPNVIFEMFNEGEWYDGAKLKSFTEHFLGFFRARSQAPLAVNHDGFRNDARADIITSHMPNWDAGASARAFFVEFAQSFRGTPAKPIFFSEPVPEWRGDATLIDAQMRLAWGTALAGAGVVLQNDVSFGYAARASIANVLGTGERGMNRAGALGRFFREGVVRVEGLAPDGRAASTQVALTRAGEEYVVYAQGAERDFTVNLAEVPADTMLKARFYSPYSGQFRATTMVRGGNAAEPFTKPDGKDWVLHLVKDGLVAEGPAGGGMTGGGGGMTGGGEPDGGTTGGGATDGGTTGGGTTDGGATGGGSDGGTGGARDGGATDGEGGEGGEGGGALDGGPTQEGDLDGDGDVDADDVALAAEGSDGGGCASGGARVDVAGLAGLAALLLAGVARSARRRR